MNAMNNQSEVACLMRQIEEEYEAATRGFHGLALGNARHDFINERMETMGRCHQQLRELVGEQQATELLVQVVQDTETGAAR